MNVMTLLLADSRFPGGGHAHSGGLEEAAARGLIRTEDDLPAFLRGRLRTAGALAATFAAASAHLAAGGFTDWSAVDAELDARTPSAAQRAASRAQGRATARAAGAMVAHRGGEHLRHAGGVPQSTGVPPALPASSGSARAAAVATLLRTIARPHHPVILGVLVGAGGGTPADAALVAAYLSVTGPASASVRLLGLDPLRVNGILAALADDVAAVAGEAAATAHLDPAHLPAPGSPGLDLLAEEHDRHHREEVRLFVS
ncbi:urease accessory UreF family protein [Actinophytocola sp.]|uniref:urease accessory UreF family protein n=1 Tax=Actinophytocola sp. TaxID=1872138 RepID=UPI00389A7AB0